ncbi:SDR family oxidoreductase [Streptomyces sp. NPDC000070]|uniref:SDR family oxidoreductase n=1 Tax=Streptomyces sp. NPDC000070 TaxID=3154240 RepID=UPI0033304D71
MGIYHVVTGATDAIGAALVLQLAADTNDEMICVVQPGDNPKERLHTALQRTAFDCLLSSQTLVTAQRRTRVLPYDLAGGQPGPLTALPRGTQCAFWHAATARPPYTSPTADVALTEGAIKLARHIGVTQFNHFSTIHVAGRQQGPIQEEPIWHPSPRNAYEAGRIATEHFLAKLTDLPIRTLRVGTVVGHSVTHRYPGRADGLFLAQRLISRHLHRSPATTPKILAQGTGLAHLVPVDHVARDAVQLHQVSAPPRTYHLTNATPLASLAVLEALVANSGAGQPELVTQAAALTTADRRLHRLLAPYTPYIDDHRHFDRSKTDLALCRDRPTGWTADPHTLQQLFRPFVDHSHHNVR